LGSVPGAWARNYSLVNQQRPIHAWIPELPAARHW
jgi:hypothetical protein